MRVPPAPLPPPNPIFHARSLFSKLDATASVMRHAAGRTPPPGLGVCHRVPHGGRPFGDCRRLAGQRRSDVEDPIHAPHQTVAAFEVDEGEVHLVHRDGALVLAHRLEKLLDRARLLAACPKEHGRHRLRHIDGALVKRRAGRRAARCACATVVIVRRTATRLCFVAVGRPPARAAAAVGALLGRLCELVVAVAAVAAVAVAASAAPAGCSAVRLAAVGALLSVGEGVVLAQEGVLEHGDGGLSVLGGDQPPQVALGVGGRQPDHRLERAGGDGQRAGGQLRHGAPQVSVGVDDVGGRLVRHLRRALDLCVVDVLFHKLGRDLLLVGLGAGAAEAHHVAAGVLVHPDVGGDALGRAARVLAAAHPLVPAARRDERVRRWRDAVLGENVAGDPGVRLLVLRVQDGEEQVEAREERVGHADVGHGRQVPVVRAKDRVGGRHDRAAGVERGVHAGLGDGDRLLLHHLVQRHAVSVDHLVELIDAAHAAVGQHHRPRLEPLATRLAVGRDSRRQAHARRAAAGG
eukprot:scaffold5496_cov112-Isochrysis_galbana.AAC.3